MNMNDGKSALTLTLKVPTTASVSHDPSLADRAKIVLMTTAGVHVIDGAAASTGGVVTLSGRVATASQRAKVGIAVASIDGVLGVRNLLEVVDGPDPVMPPAAADVPTDNAIRAKVEAALQSEGGRALEALKVTRVEHGVVHMSGKGVTLTGRLRAIELAWNAAEGAASI